MANGHLSLALQQLRTIVRRQGAGALPDGQLLERFVRDRDEAAFEVLVWRHGPMVLGMCQRLLRNRHDAEDVLQATFLTLVRKAGSIGKRESLGSWLYKVAYRIALRARARTAKQAAGPVGDVAQADRAEDAHWRELRPLLDSAIQKLPERYRTPIVLYYLQGKTHREMAEQLGCPLSTAASRLARGRELLRRRLARHAVVLSGGALGSALAANAVSAVVTPPVVAAAVRAASLCDARTAGAIPANVAGLVEGAKQAMTTKYKAATVLVLGLGLIGAGAALARRNAPGPAPRASGEEAESPAAAHNPGTPAGETVVVTGRVLDPEGRPFAGARLYSPRMPKQEPRDPGELEAPPRGVSAENGSFRVEIPAADVRPGQGTLLIAAADGYGVGWAEVRRGKQPADLTVRLAKDHLIRGRVLNTEGRPQPGVRATVVTLMENPGGGLDSYLTTWKREWQMAAQQTPRRLYWPLGKLCPASPTDQDGRFEIHGAGAERVALVMLQGPGIAQATLYVVTREGFDPAPYNRAVQGRERINHREPGQTPVLYGPKVQYVAPATRVIEGVVRSSETGKPVAGVMVSVIAGYNNSVIAASDGQGRYRLVGLPKAKDYSLIAEPPKGTDWLRRIIAVPDQGGLEPLHADIDMVRGLIVTGRVIDRQTGKGVRAGLRFAPLPDNAFFGKKPGYDSYRTDRLTSGTDADGRFRLPVIPGSGALLVQAYGGRLQVGDTSVNPYKLAELTPAERKQLGAADDGNGSYYFRAAGQSLEFLGSENACKVVNFPDTGGTVNCDLYLDRGATATVRIEDPEGKPIPGTIVSGITASWPKTFPLNERQCSVYALDPKRPRTLVVYHPGRNLGGTLTVRGDEKGPLTARLVPAASVTGRILDTDGHPVAGAEVGFNYPSEIARELVRVLDRQREAVRTDKAGRFRLEGAVPDLQFGLNLIREGKLLVGEPRIGLHKAKPGLTLDLGDHRTRPYP